MVHNETLGRWTDGVAHYARYFCIDICRFYFSSCTCVAASLVRYLRQCSAANPADIYVPSMTVLGLKDSSLQYTLLRCAIMTEL